MKKLKLLITRAIPNPIEQELKKYYEVELGSEEKPLSKEELKIRIRNKDAIISLLSDPLDKEVLSEANNLKIISQFAVGYDNIDISYAKEKGILITNTPGVLTETTADTAWALLMAVARRIVESDTFIRAGKWKYGWGSKLMLGRDINGKKIGIIGLGRIGLAVAKRAKCFNMKIYYYNKQRKESIEKEFGIEYLELNKLLKECDFISLHTPLTDKTYHMIGEKEFKLMKKTSFIINTSRGKVIDEKALIRALKEGWIQGAGLDVFYEEPLPLNSELLKLDNAVIAPHIGSGSVETREKMAEIVTKNLISFAKGEELPNPIN